MAAQLVRGKLAALALGPAGVGIFNQLSVLWNLFNVAGGLGSYLGVVQHGTEALAKNDDDALRRLGSTFLLLLGVVSCLLALVGVLFAPQLSSWVLHDGGAHAQLVALILLSIPFAVAAQTYHALLAARRAVRALVITQVATDVGAMIVFAALIFPLGLTGAVAGFIATYVIMLVAKGFAVGRLLAPDLCWPRPREFSWKVVRSNVGYGASGLLMVAVTNLAVLLVSRIIISRLGVDANGIFANSWRIGSVYLGSVTATATAYLMPTLGRCETDSAISEEINSALRFYLYVLPLPMAAIMAGGEFLVWLILSRQFLPVAGLLLLMVPAELLRIFSETVAMTLVVRRRMFWYSFLSAAQSAVFLLGAAVLVPVMGLWGAAVAYLAGYFIGAVANLLAAWSFFGVAVQPGVLRLIAFAAVLLVGVAAVSSEIGFGFTRVAVATLFCVIWIGLVLLEPAARSFVAGLLGRSNRRGAA